MHRGDSAHRADGGGSRRHHWGTRARRAALVTLVSATALGAGAQTSSAQSLEIAVANNMYPALKDIAPYLESQYSLNPFSFNAAGQGGGFWRDASVDTTTLRGITSGNARQQILGPGPYTGCNPTSPNPNPNCEQGPLQIDAFFSADETNVNAVIPTANGGTCTTNGTTITVCPGIAATKTALVTGQLAIYRCDSTYDGDGASPGSPNNPAGAVNGSGNGAPNSPNCDAPAGGQVSLSSANMAGVLDWLDDAPGHRLSIADPASAPFGAAARQALISAGFGYNPGTNVFPAATCDAQSSGVCKVRLEAGITQVRGSVTSGTTAVGLAALSNLKNISFTSGTLNGQTIDDPNQWDVVSPTAYSVYGPINQWGVGIRRSTPDSAKEAKIATILSDWSTDATIQAILATYGY